MVRDRGRNVLSFGVTMALVVSTSTSKMLTIVVPSTLVIVIMLSLCVGVGVDQRLICLESSVVVM